MNKNKHVINLIIGGIFFLLPLLLLSLVIGRIFKLLKPISNLIASQLETPNTLNIILVYLASVVVLLLVCYVAGILLHRGILKNWNQAMDEKLFYLMPGVQRFKFSITGKKAKLWDQLWQAGLIKDNDCYRPGYISEGADPGYYCVFFPDAPRMESGEIRYYPKDQLKYHLITMKEMADSFKKFGRTLPVSEVIRRETGFNKTDNPTLI